MRRLLATGLLLASALAALRADADTTVEDLAKYKRLRARLLTDFTSVGGAPGQSQPAPERNDGESLMKWGDGTIALGFYLGVLATEHFMLSNTEAFPGADNGDATQIDKTLDELYYALLALERLDESADAAFPPPCATTPSLNGFFIRDDVPANFNAHFPGIATILSDMIDPILTNKEMSQDQVYHVQSGLALVVALVPSTVVVRGRALRAWAIGEEQRIALHFAKGDWVIRNPACGGRQVARGANAIGYSYGEALAVKFATAGALTPTTIPLAATVWDTLRQPTNPAYRDADNLHMALAIMAVGDGYGPNTAQVTATLAATQDWPLYPLLHRALHGPGASGFCATAPTVNARARLMLDELPAAGEPACPGPSGPAPHGWTIHNRFIRSKDQAYVGPPGCVGMRYHGLDYMLLHNLYAISTPGTWKGDAGADPCAGSDAGVDAGQDAGTRDSGISDGGSRDAQADAGGPDAGEADAGASDAGALLDAGESEMPPVDAWSCGCGAVATGSALVAVVPIVGFTRRRRRRWGPTHG